MRFRPLHGAVAQLGERFNGIEEVRSSILLSSIILQMFYVRNGKREGSCAMSLPNTKQDSLSFARRRVPRYCIVTPVNWPGFITKFLSMVCFPHETFALCPVVVFLGLMVFCSPSYGRQAPIGESQNAASTDIQADVVILVTPRSAEEAKVALVYNNSIPKDRVRHEIKLLIKATGGELGNDLAIDSKSIQPNDLKRFPIRSGASFTLLHSPQVHDLSPTLAPYLSAFQAWNHIEVIFSLPDLSEYNGIQTFESPELSVTLLRDPGVYRYEASIREHKKPLPELVVVRNASSAIARVAPPPDPVISKENRVKQEPSASVLPIVLFLLGSCLTGGVAGYLFLARRPRRA